MIKSSPNRLRTNGRESHPQQDTPSVSDHARVKRAAMYVWGVVLLATALGLLAWWRILLD